ncbi:TRAP transporter substrate-binding protein DctP [uncultured Kiloniella sp.]|uniref:TRAP transporter substrate-binding protein n=1 Tax=uncultured Kiloniella sp. TaxID=1133091 RepID=UPI0026361236|nr:TRAP transporter substrate-binding protein DctP [uncultured Kiloniella sp.]
MKKILSGLIAGAVFSSFVGAAHAETTLRLTLQLPLKHPLGQNISSFKEEVEKESNGELKIEVFPSAQLFKDKEVPQAVASGAIEMGIASLTRFVGTVPAVDAFYVPFLFDSSEKVQAATAPGSSIRQILDPAIEKTGAKPLWYQAFGGAIVLTKGDKPIVVPADAKGKKIRSFGATISDTIEALDAAPTIMSGSKQFLAYQNGTVDAGMTGITAAQSRKLYEVMDHLTLTNHADIEFIVVINNDVWNGLSEKEQAIITKAGQRVEQELRASIANKEAEARKYLADKINIIELTDEQRAEWKKATSSVVDAYVERAGAEGKAIVEAAGKL